MKVKFVPQNVEFEIKPGESVMHLAQDNGLYIKSVCKGVPSCAECRVRVIEGDHNVMPPGSEELSLIGSGHFIDRRRLSCQLKCFGDVTIDMNEQLAKQNGLVVGRKKKLVGKDDRVEQAVVRRSEVIEGEEPVEGADLNAGGAAGETVDRPARAPQENRGAGDRSGRPGGDRGPRNERGPRENRGGGGGGANSDRGHRGGGPQARGPGSSPSPSRPSGEPGSRPQQQSQQQPQGPRPEGPGGPQNAQGPGVGEGPAGESREGGARKRRRRRGKGGGGAGGGPGGNPGGSGPSGGGPGGGTSSAPSRPSTSN